MADILIVFSDDYSELGIDPVGILALTKPLSAFKENHEGSESVVELLELGGFINICLVKHGLNAFYKTGLCDMLTAAKVKNVVLAGAVTSICIDATAKIIYY